MTFTKQQNSIIEKIWDLADSKPDKKLEKDACKILKHTELYEDVTPAQWKKLEILFKNK